MSGRLLRLEFAVLLAVPLASFWYAVSTTAVVAQGRCLSDAEIERVVGDQIRSGALLVDTRALPDIPLCSRLTVAQTIQRLREQAFPEEAAQEEDEREALTAQDRAPRRATVRVPARRAPVRARSTAPRAPVQPAAVQPAAPSRKVRSKTGTATPRR